MPKQGCVWVVCPLCRDSLPIDVQVVEQHLSLRKAVFSVQAREVTHECFQAGGSSAPTPQSERVPRG